MRIISNNGSLLYDESHPDCSIVITESQGQPYAFIEALDMSGGEPTGMTKRYWGAFAWGDEEQSIKDILRNGGKWPDLPA